MKLNIHLYREEVREFNDCLRRTSAKHPFEEIGDGPLEGGGSYRIYRTKPVPKAPPWVAFLRDHVKEDRLKGVENVNQAAIVLLHVPTSKGLRFFAVTYGHGHCLIEKERIEWGFGLKATLDVVSSNDMTVVDSRDMGALAQQKRVVSSVPTRVRAFPFDEDMEIVQNVGGRCADQTFGQRIDGADSAHLSVRGLTFGMIAEKCKKLHEAFESKRRKADLDFFERRKIVKGRAVTDALEELLVRSLRAKQSDANIHATLPDQIDQPRFAEALLFGLGPEHRIDGDFSLSHVYDYLEEALDGRDLRRDDLKRIKVKAVDGDGQGWPEALLNHLVFETDHEGRRYVLANRKWYQIDESYFEDIKAQVADLPTWENAPLLPWGRVFSEERKDTREGGWSHQESAYNEQYVNHPDFLVLDRREVHVGSKGDKDPIEIADLFHWPTKKLICVKRWDRSRNMSHLLAQGAVSARLIQRSGEYREKFIEKIRAKWPSETSSTNFKELLSELTFVYAIGSERPGMKREDISVFSRINLLKVVRELRRWFEVEVTMIEMVPDEIPSSVSSSLVPKDTSPTKETDALQEQRTHVRSQAVIPSVPGRSGAISTVWRLGPE